jgi:hypothetical protein
MKRVRAERDAAIAEAARWKADALTYSKVASEQRAETEALRLRAKRLEMALRAVWNWEEAVQRDLKLRGEVSDGTMYLQLGAVQLRDAALAGGSDG